MTTFREACLLVLRDCPDGYAKAYANAGKTMTDAEEIQCQCLYILNNMGNWRGEVATICRTVFKELSKRRKRK